VPFRRGLKPASRHSARPDPSGRHPARRHHRQTEKLGWSIAYEGGQMYITGWPGNENRNPA